VLHAVEGWGKTSLAAHAPRPIFIQSRGETGLETLIQSGMIADTPRFPECDSWKDIIGAVDALTDENHQYRTLVIDTINGSERLCHENVCVRDFGGDWGERGFASYGRGADVSLADWLLLLKKLDTLRELRRMTILLLAHTKITTFKNPEGADFDRYQADMHKTTYAATAKWSDAILFGNFEVVVDTKRRGDTKGKATLKRRVLYTERSAAFDAKNRMGLPVEIDMGDSSAEAWLNFSGALKTARESRRGATSARVVPQPVSEALGVRAQDIPVEIAAAVKQAARDQNAKHDASFPDMLDSFRHVKSYLAAIGHENGTVDGPEEVAAE
jgi:hypothetical protein